LARFSASGGFPICTASGRLRWGVILQSLGVKLVMVEDPEQTKRIKARWARRKRHDYPHVGDLDPSARVRPRTRKENPSRQQFKGNTQWAIQMNLRRATLLEPDYIKRLALQASEAARRKRRSAAMPASITPALPTATDGPRLNPDARSPENPGL
jgi:hypothetical protein